jgi:VanZ family protein
MKILKRKKTSQNIRYPINFKFYFKFYLPALIWAGIIFYFSSVPGLRYSQSNAVEIILRKGAHFLEYGILSFFLWRIFYLGHKFPPQKAFWGALIFSALFGASDELHQTFVFGRTGKTVDAVFDAISSILTLNLIVPLAKKKNRINWKNIFVLFFSAVILIALVLWMIKEDSRLEILPPRTNQDKESLEIWPKKKSAASDKREVGAPVTEKDLENIPASAMVEVPFTPQAPYGLWDELHEEACEEASLVMLKHYLDHTDLNPEIAEKEIQAMMEYEMEKSGGFKDTDAQETRDLFYNFYGWSVSEKKLSIVYDFQREDIKKFLSRGNPIIVPAAGRKLENPYFTPPGPLYHNLVLVGYKGDTIIVNDPGTKRGKNYRYNADILYEAIHDFPGTKENIGKGRKAMIILE